MDRFNACHVHTARWEGGWSDHPDDNGGRTMYGVTQGTFDQWNRQKGLPRRDVATLTEREAREIYKAWYWTPVRCGDMPPGFDMVLYDAGVNSGPKRSVRWFQSGLGVASDGKVGPATIAAAKKASQGTQRGVDAIKAIMAQRMSFLRNLDDWRVFGRGWSRRCADIEAVALQMHLQLGGNTLATAALAQTKEEADVAARRAGKDLGAVTGGGAVAAGGSAAVPVVPDTAVLIILAIVAVAAVALFLKRRQQKDRLDALTRAMEA